MSTIHPTTSAAAPAHAVEPRHASVAHAPASEIEDMFTSILASANGGIVGGLVGMHLAGIEGVVLGALAGAAAEGVVKYAMDRRERTRAGATRM